MYHNNRDFDFMALDVLKVAEVPHKQTRPNTPSSVQGLKKRWRCYMCVCMCIDMCVYFNIINYVL